MVEKCLIITDINTVRWLINTVMHDYQKQQAVKNNEKFRSLLPNE